MRLVDLNLLLYASNSDSPRHAVAHAWLEATVGGTEAVALPWVVILGFLRLTTHPRVMARPLMPEQSLQLVDSWLARSNVVVLQPGPNHWAIFRSLLMGTRSAGNLTTDAHLAALAIEHGCELCSTDADFARFPGLNWRNPL